jgi:hypothetical protein
VGLRVTVGAVVELVVTCGGALDGEAVVDVAGGALVGFGGAGKLGVHRSLVSDGVWR